MTGLSSLPAVRGKLILNADLAPYTWFRVGGPCDALFIPADADDLQAFLKALPAEVPVTVLGVGSNVIIRDGGLEGVVIRLMGKAFSAIEVDAAAGQIRAGAGALDSMVAKAAAKAGLAGLEFYAGVPGTIGGALTMNAGCYGAETKDVLVSARVMDRTGEIKTISNVDFGFTYRKNALPEGLIFLDALYQGQKDTPDAVQARMDAITTRRETSQPIREKTGGSTFKNPEGHSAWKLVDQAGFRGKLHGGAKFSELHSNFMINADNATAKDLESLGDLVRQTVKDQTGIELHWEIKRLGREG